MTSNTTSAPFAYDDLDRVIHERARLGLLTSLMTHTNGLSFSDLKQLCDLTDGNLNRHLHVLEEEGLVRITKTTEKKRALTLCHITPSGRERFTAYLAALEKVVQDAARVLRPQPSPQQNRHFKPSTA